MGAALTVEQGHADKPIDASDVTNLHQARNELRQMAQNTDDNGKLKDELLRVCQREICRARRLIVESDIDSPSVPNVAPPFFSKDEPGRSSKQLDSGENLVKLAQAMVQLIEPYLEMEEAELEIPINELLVLKQEKKRFVQEKNYVRAGEQHKLVLAKEQKLFDDQTQLLAMRMKASKLVQRLKRYVAELKPRIANCAKRKEFLLAGTFKIYKDRALTLHAGLGRFVNRMTPNKAKEEFNSIFIKSTVSRRACLEPHVKEQLDRESTQPRARGIPVTAGWRPLDDPDYIACRGGPEKYYFRMDHPPDPEAKLFGATWEGTSGRTSREQQAEQHTPGPAAPAAPAENQPETEGG
jgi:hypothetical protein